MMTAALNSPSNPSTIDQDPATPSFEDERTSHQAGESESAATHPLIVEEHPGLTDNNNNNDDDGDDGGDNNNHQHPQGLTKPSLTFLNGLALILSLQIGSGIFSAPSQVSNHVPAPGFAVLVWLCAGLLVWTGAASFIELGLMLPANGGLQEYLRVCYGEFWGFLFTWAYIGIAKPCANAIIAMVFAENIGIALNPDWTMPVWLMKIVAVAGVGVITFINCLGSKTGAKVAISFLALKLFAVFSIGIIGVAVGLGAASGGQDDPPSRPPTKWFTADPNPDRQQMALWTTMGEYITAAYGALFCYGGWETIGFVAGDLINPSRDLPRAITTAMVVAIVGFVLMNISLFTVIPFDMVRERSVVAVDFGLQIFGPWGGFVYSLIVSLSCLGALNANVFATGRLCIAASQQDYAPRVLANRHCASREGDAIATRRALSRLPEFCARGILWFAKMTETLRWDKGVPIYAMLGNSSIAILFTVIGTFNSLVTFIGIAEYTFFLLGTAGIFILRRHPPHHHRRRRRWHHDTATTPNKAPYQTPTVVVLIFCLFATCLVLRGVISDPMQGVAIGGLGLGAWGLVWRRRS